VTPDSYALARSGEPLVASRTVGTKALRIDPLPTGGTIEREVDERDRTRSCLDDRALEVLRDTALRVERHFGRPQDIEWAFEGGRLHVLQSRPITSLPPEVADLSRLGRLERFVLDDILEHFPDAPHPLDYEAVVDTYEQIQKMAREAGVDAPPATSIITFAEDGLCGVVPRAPRLSWRMLGFPVVALRKLRAAPGAWGRDHAAAVLATLEAAAARDVTACDDETLARSLHDIVALASRIGALRFSLVIAPWTLTRTLLGWLTRLAGRRLDNFEWLAGLSYHTTETEIALQELADWACARPPILRALLDVRAAALPALGSDDPEWTARVQAFLTRFGARTMKLYLPFTARAWAEDPEALLATIQALLRAHRPGAAQERMASGRARFERLFAEVRARLPRFLRRPFGRTVEKFRAFHVEREATVYQLERTWAEARRIVGEIAARLAARGALARASDTLLLTTRELLALLARELDETQARRRVLLRRERRAAAVAYWQAHRLHGALAPAEGTLRGQAGSPGVAEGPVRVVRAPDEFHKLGRGDVLVCPFTDPAWTPLFALASAVVADTGGPLSHAAIVAREYGIPAVLGVQSGTLELADGEQVSVDGLRGVVERRATHP
jgi:pyruvate,water dikinase